MKIQDSKPVSAVQAVKRAPPPPAGQTAMVENTGDSASVMGIPESEFTPRVRDAIMTLMQEVDRFRQELERAKQRIDHLEKLAEYDPLTPVLNRRGFVREMTRIKSFVDRYNTPAALVFFDLDNFKPVNDRFGHAAGDAVLLRVTQVLVEHTRDSDVVGRLGGDEFGVILVNTGAETAMAKAEKLAATIAAQQFHSGAAVYNVTASFGIHVLQPGDDPATALARADEAMYASKRRKT